MVFRASTVCVCIHAHVQEKIKVRKCLVNVFFFLKTHPQADMVLIRITSLQWQSSLCRTMKNYQGYMTEERPEQAAMNTVNTSHLAAHTDLYAFQLGHMLFPYIECNI